MNLMRRCGAKFDAVKNLGPLQAAVNYATRRVCNRIAPSAQIRVLSRYAQYPLWCRPGTSDPDVFRQVYAERAYRCLDAVREAGLIIDCGANVGFSAAYFLTRYPTAVLIAVEPDPGNFAQLKRNLAPYGARARAFRSGIWSHPVGLILIDTPGGDGREWTRGVRPIAEGEVAQMTAIDIGTLWTESGHPRISVLKIDIEGAEQDVFGTPCPWLTAVDNLVIELHDPESTRRFHDAIRDQGFAISTCGELTVCRR